MAYLLPTCDSLEEQGCNGQGAYVGMSARIEQRKGYINIGFQGSRQKQSRSHTPLRAPIAATFRGKGYGTS